MFAPNRLLTVKEQWLLAGIVVAVLAGSVALFLQGRLPQSSESVVIVPAATVLPAAPAVVEPAPVSPAMPKPQELSGVVAVSVPEAPVTGSLPLEPRLIGVAAMGAVRKPGLYMVPEHYRVADLIAQAGGVTEKADISELAMTAPLLDETTLTVPERPESFVAGIQVSARRDTATYRLNPAQYLKRSRLTHPTGQQGSAVSVSGPRQETSVTQAGMQDAGGLVNINHATSEQLQQLPGIGPVLAGAIIAERERQPFATVDDLQRVHGIGDKRLAAIRALVTAP